MDIFVIGIGAIDVIHQVKEYPQDSSDQNNEKKVRGTKNAVLSMTPLSTHRGGNGTNALVVCAQLVNNSCKWIGTCTDPIIDRDAAFIFNELEQVGIDCSNCQILQTGSLPTSYIVSSEETGSRTIVHSRSLPELSVEQFKHQIETYFTRTSIPNQWFHFEGRDMVNVLEMVRFLRSYRLLGCFIISVEIESLRQDWNYGKELVALSDFAFVSKDFVQSKLRMETATRFLNEMRRENLQFSKAIFCPWGSEGVYYITSSSKVTHYTPTKSLSKVVDSVGAGDTFIGATIASLVKSSSIHQAAAFACNVATAKCAQEGLIFAPDVLNTWISSWNANEKQKIPPTDE
ncbi:hypothetical protein ABG067_000661 [Albugo candida]